MTSPLPAPTESGTPFVFVVIATALNRTDLLIDRSLLSVYRQRDVPVERVKIIVVDDNDTGKDGLPSKLQVNRHRIAKLRQILKLRPTEFETVVMPNLRTKHHSGTGAWNTGIDVAFQQFPRGCTAILDDDDEFTPHHLHDCLKVFSSTPQILAVFQELKWQNEDGSHLHFPLTYDALNETAFFIGNPGIQGSNMFFRTASLIEIGGFDETLTGSTDRDLMIRFLRRIKEFGLGVESSIRIINTVGVIHHNHQGARITQSNSRKHLALDMFYKKHRVHFTADAYRMSTERAYKLFNYRPDDTSQ
jgi:hypothetical protein